MTSLKLYTDIYDWSEHFAFCLYAEINAFKLKQYLKRYTIVLEWFVSGSTRAMITPWCVQKLLCIQIYILQAIIKTCVQSILLRLGVISSIVH